MKFSIISVEKRLKIFEPEVRSILKKLEKIIRLEPFYHFEIYLVGDKLLKKNVLSYVAPKEMPRPDIKGKFLGEIHLNPLRIQKNKESLPRMLVHGLLHLVGYNHKKKSDRIKMEKKEAMLLKILNPKS
jgi:rRNA maturation RNase YbeY